MNDDLKWLDKEFSKKGDNMLVDAPGEGKKIALFFYRKANVGNRENRVYLQWEGKTEKMFDGKLWYCGVDGANLTGMPREGPENKKLIVNLSGATPVSITVAYKVLLVRK